MSRMNQGTRTKEAPRGDGTKKKETVANTLLDRVLVLVRAAPEAGTLWAIENPGTSYLWHDSELNK